MKNEVTQEEEFNALVERGKIQFAIEEHNRKMEQKRKRIAHQKLMKQQQQKKKSKSKRK